MKSINVNYRIFSNKVNEKQKVILISDAHDVFTKSKMQKQLINDINSQGAHHVAIAGDTMQGSKYDDVKKIAELSYFLDGIAEAQPVVLSLGNHDLVGLTEEGRKAFKGLGGHPDVYPLDNKSITIDNFRITGFSTGREAYAPANHGSGKANELYANDWNSFGLTIATDSRYFEELVGHAPHPLASPYVQQNANGIRDFDMYLAGHLHDGYVPAWLKGSLLDKLGDNGVWEMPIEKSADGKVTRLRPWIYSPINLCRGVHYVGENGLGVMQLENGNYYGSCQDESKQIPIVVSGGINKFFGLPTSPEITNIDIYPSEKAVSEGARRR